MLLKRAKVRRTDQTTSRHYWTADGSAELVEVRWTNPNAYGRYWLAIQYRPVLRIIRKRTKPAALKALARIGR
jgi:hypothetical protein